MTKSITNTEYMRKITTNKERIKQIEQESKQKSASISLKWY